MDMVRYCPACQEEHAVELLGTTNEWQYYCAVHDIRFNENDAILGEKSEEETP